MSGRAGGGSKIDVNGERNADSGIRVLEKNKWGRAVFTRKGRKSGVIPIGNFERFRGDGACVLLRGPKVKERKLGDERRGDEGGDPGSGLCWGSGRAPAVL